MQACIRQPWHLLDQSRHEEQPVSIVQCGHETWGRFDLIPIKTWLTSLNFSIYSNQKNAKQNEKRREVQKAKASVL